MNIAAVVQELAEERDELAKLNAEFIKENQRLTDENADLQAHINGMTRELDELFDMVKYFEELHPDYKEAWKVKRRMEDA